MHVCAWKCTLVAMHGDSFAVEAVMGTVWCTSPKTEVSLPLGKLPNVRVKAKEHHISPLSRAVFGFVLVLPTCAGVFLCA